MWSSCGPASTWRRDPVPLRKVTGQAIATDAERYIGDGYVYGGDASKPGDWDCSSFVSYVLGHDLGLALPGGRYGGPGMPPNAHGPVVTSYASWPGASAVGVPSAGDLCCWVGSGTSGHIGIAISSSEMVSALNPDVGVQRTPIVGTGPAGSPLVYRRVSGVPAGGAAFLNAVGQSGGLPSPAAGAAALILAVLAPFIVIGAMAVGASVLAAAAAWALRKAVSA
jgi:hypothetical protein